MILKFNYLILINHQFHQQLIIKSKNYLQDQLQVQFI